MDNELKGILIEALDMKIASVRRARNTSKNPRFNAIYDAEEALANKARVWVDAQKVT